jgi:hypothetical protein
MRRRGNVNNLIPDRYRKFYPENLAQYMGITTEIADQKGNYYYLHTTIDRTPFTIIEDNICKLMDLKVDICFKDKFGIFVTKLPAYIIMPEVRTSKTETELFEKCINDITKIISKWIEENTIALKLQPDTHTHYILKETTNDQTNA